MTVVIDTDVLLDFFDGNIKDPFELIRPYKVISISPVVLHEVLRSYPEDIQARLVERLKDELLPSPSAAHWYESARILKRLYSRRIDKNISRMQNDVLIALAARELNSPLWSRDTDFQLICDYLSIPLITN